MVVPYIGTWIETERAPSELKALPVVPYIGTWIETLRATLGLFKSFVVPYIGTWIETLYLTPTLLAAPRRTLYRYVD